MKPKRKFGEVREDGYRFITYRKAGGEKWASPSSWLRYRMLSTRDNTKKRAAALGVPHDIDADYLLSIFPADCKCPVLGISLEWGRENGQENSPSLDRIRPELGYVKGNVHFISSLANCIKTNATPDQIIRVGEYFKAITANAIT